MSDPLVFTVIVGKKLYEVKALTPLRAVIEAREQHGDSFAGDFNEVCVFEGSAPECIYQPRGIYVV